MPGAGTDALSPAARELLGGLKSRAQMLQALTLIVQRMIESGNVDNQIPIFGAVGQIGQLVLTDEPSDNEISEAWDELRDVQLPRTTPVGTLRDLMAAGDEEAVKNHVRR